MLTESHVLENPHFLRCWKNLFFPSLLLIITKSYGYRLFLKHHVSVTSLEVKPTPPQATRRKKKCFSGFHLHSKFLFLSFHFSNPGEGNGNPLQYSCLENAVGRGASWAAVRGVAQSRSRLNRLSMHACMHWRREWQPTPVFLPGESQGQRRLVGCRLWGHTESDTTEVS